jgi:DNA-binding XRE family transcriptional regulator
MSSASGPAVDEVNELRLRLGRAQEQHDALVTLVRGSLEAIERGEDARFALGPLAQRVRHYPSKWTRERVIQAAQEWHERYGEAPAADDWRPWQARARNPDADVSRWSEGDWPSYHSATRPFGGWFEMLAAAGLEPKEPRDDDKGGARRTEEMPEWTGWHLIAPLRERAGLSIAQAALRAGMLWPNWSQLEKGKRPNPTIRTVLAVAQGLGVRPGVLLEFGEMGQKGFQ